MQQNRCPFSHSCMECDAIRSLALMELGRKMFCLVVIARKCFLQLSLPLPQLPLVADFEAKTEIRKWKMDEIQQNQESNSLPVTSFQSDDLIEKLKLLNYEKQLLHDLKMKPLSRFYFVKSVNPGEQFYMFTLICWWLCKKLGKDMDQPQEFDDPNTITAKIIQILNEMVRMEHKTNPLTAAGVYIRLGANKGIKDVGFNFPPTKLIRGAGPICLQVLDTLATQAMKVAKVTCQRPVITQEDEDATEYMEDNAEIILEKLEDEQQAALSDDSDMELDGSAFRNLNWISKETRLNGRLDDSSQLPESSEKLTDQQNWRLELERVLPHLKVYVKADARDWRSHYSQIETLKSNIEEISDEAQSQLKKLHSEFTFSLDKVESREKHLNNELRSLIEQFKDISIQLSNVQYAQTQVQTDTEHVMSQLNEVIVENDTKKAEMEQRGQSMSDGSSVVQIRKATAKLREEVSQLNLEVALLVHSIDQDIIKQTSAYGEVENLNNKHAIY